jgi:hypothetical protein
MSDKADASKINQATVQKKRGRKSKKELELASQAQNAENINVVMEESACDNCVVTDENTVLSSVVDNTEEDDANDTNIFLSTDNSILTEDTKPVAKKRGRKPKGGKIIQQVVPTNNNLEPKPNVILHLKCSIKDLQSNSVNGQDIQSFDIQNQAHLSYEMINPPAEFLNNAPVSNNEIITTQTKHVEDDSEPDDSNIDTKEVWKKLKALEHNLHINNICDKKSACFWCTCDFDNPPVYIPKYYVKDSYNVYGCFCSPECATAYLMEENIDSSARFERYHFLNHIYSKIYDYNKNIKPAPNPYYLLDKYYGNLSIQEYRSLLRNERLFLVVDKPLTRILPELHEDNDDFIINNKIIPSNTFQIKKKLQKKQTKTNILSDHFGLAH